jgi:predicted nucleic acid-binding protein
LTLRYLLDTNVLSETRRKSPDPHVVSFLSSADSSAFFLSVLTIGELRKGIAMRQQSDAVAASQLNSWVDGLQAQFSKRILGIDIPTAKLWGSLSAQRPRPVIDTLLAATAMTHDLILVTRNIRDVEDIGVRLLNPWTR